MIPSRQDVIDAYRCVLGRNPESEAIIRNHMRQQPSLSALVTTLMQSGEAKLRSGLARLGNREGLLPADADFLLRFHAPSPSTPGMYTDFIGARTDVHFAQELTDLDGLVDTLPFPADKTSHAIEWIAVLLAAERSGEMVVALDIGAGHAPWLVRFALAARRCGHGGSGLYLRALDADASRCDYARSHLEHHGLAHGSTVETVLLALSPGEAFVPEMEPRQGRAEVAVAFRSEDCQPDRAYRKTRALTLALCLEEGTAPIDLLRLANPDLTIEMLAQASAEMSARVRHLLLKTGGRRLEADCMELLPSLGFRLERQLPSMPKDGQAHGDRRGVQFWRNCNL